MVWPLLVAGLASTAVQYASQQSAADKAAKAAKAKAKAGTPMIEQGNRPAAYQAQAASLGQSAPQQQAFQAQAPKPFTPTQVVTSAGWDASKPGGGAAMPMQSPDMEGMWASDYSKGMSGAGAPMSPTRPQVSGFAPGIQSPVAPLYSGQPSAASQGAAYQQDQSTGWF